MLGEKDYERIRQELDNCSRPLFFFDDDPDGLCAFLLLYRYKKEGKGVCVKSVPKLDRKFIGKVKEYEPDKVFILDVAVVTEEFVEAADVPIVWVDHHQPSDLHKVVYFNPMAHEPPSNEPTSSICYHAVMQESWIGAVGTVGDWQIPLFIDKFNEENPKLKLAKKDPGKLLYSSKIGKIARIFSFLLKGDVKEVMTCVKILTRISGPEEILKADTPQSKYLKNRHKEIAGKYESLISEAKKKAGKDGFLVFTYPSDKWSFTSDLSNELLYKYPKKIIIVGREKEDEVRMSIRGKKAVLPALQKALIGVEGYGGGHEHAVGACVKKHDFERFVGNLREYLGD